MCFKSKTKDNLIIQYATRLYQNIVDNLVNQLYESKRYNQRRLQIQYIYLQMMRLRRRLYEIY